MFYWQCGTDRYCLFKWSTWLSLLPTDCPMSIRNCYVIDVFVAFLFCHIAVSVKVFVILLSQISCFFFYLIDTWGNPFVENSVTGIKTCGCLTNVVVLLLTFPPCTKKPLISAMRIYIQSSLCKWGLGTRREKCCIDKKSKGCRLTTHKMHYSQWKITSIVHFLIKAWNLA